MKNKFIWKECRTLYREERLSRHGSETRWILNQEMIENSATAEIVTRGTIRHPGISVIIPVLEDGRILLMHQFRYAAGELLWELPAGTLIGREENGRFIPTEGPIDCARRELAEETGYEATILKQIGKCYAMPGTSDEVIHFFVATELTAGEQSLDIGEVIDELRAFTIDDLKRMISEDVIRDAKTIIGLLLFAGYSDNSIANR